MASQDEDQGAPAGPSEEETIERHLVRCFRDLGFGKAMAEDLVAARVDWREAERLLAKTPPGGHSWVYWFLMP
jgi:hypothetical protein